MIMHSSDKSASIRALRSAAPYIRLFKGKTFVVKAGGAVFGNDESTRALIEQVAILHTLGIRVVLVHGGGPQLTQVTEAMGVPTRMVQGRRVTDEKAIDNHLDGAQRPHNTKLLAICRNSRSTPSAVGRGCGLIRRTSRPVKVEARWSTTAWSATSTWSVNRC